MKILSVVMSREIARGTKSGARIQRTRIVNLEKREKRKSKTDDVRGISPPPPSSLFFPTDACARAPSRSIFFASVVVPRNNGFCLSLSLSLSFAIVALFPFGLFFVRAKVQRCKTKYIRRAAEAISANVAEKDETRTIHRNIFSRERKINSHAHTRAHFLYQRFGI